MIRGKMKRISTPLPGLLLLALLLLASRPAGAQAPASIYVLSIGSAHYDTDFSHFEAGFDGWPKLPAAATSARQMVKLLRSRQAVYVDTLISRKSTLVTRKAILAAVKRLSARARQDKNPNKLLVFYFAGHGVSEGFGWNLFLMPGDFHAKIKGRTAAAMAEVSVYAGEVYDELEKAKLPFMMLLDCCYEGRDEQGTLKVLAHQQAFQPITEVAQAAMGAVRMLNQFVEPNPVVFSAKPGNLAPTVPLPGGKPNVEVGPVCRRALLAQAQLGNAPLTLERLLTALTNPALDPAEKSVALTHWDREACPFQNYRLK